MPGLPTELPAALQAGDTIAWQRSLPDYPADDGWVLAYRLINATARIDVVATAAGAAHRVDIAASASSGYAAGTYTWTAFVTRGAERYTVAQGETRVLPDLAASVDGVDARSPARRALADLRAALLTWLSSAGHVAEYEIAGRRMRFASADDIRKRISLLEREIAAENAASGQVAGRRVLVRF